MNILHLGCGYLPSNGGNVIRMRMLLENNVATENDNIYVYTPSKSSKEFSEEEYYYKTGIKIIRFNNLSEVKLNLSGIVKKYNIQIVVTHTIPTNVIACMKLPKHVVIVSEFHTLIQSHPLKMFGKQLLHRFFLNKRTSKYFVLSKGAANYISKKFRIPKKDIVFLPNGYHMKDDKKESGLKKNWFTFGYVGTFFSWQGINIIYSNLDNILDINPNIRIYLVGSGKKYDEFHKLSLMEKYKNRLIVTGMVPKNEIDDHMKEIDVLMIPRPSTLETETAIPLKIFEGVSFGKPLIISNVYGLTEVLSKEDAFIFDASEEFGLTEACKLAYENPLLRQEKIKNAEKTLSKWPTWMEIQERQHKVFKLLMNKD